MNVNALAYFFSNCFPLRFAQRSFEQKLLFDKLRELIVDAVDEIDGEEHY